MRKMRTQMRSMWLKREETGGGATERERRREKAAGMYRMKQEQYSGTGMD